MKIERKVREHNRKLRKIQKIEKSKKKGSSSKRLIIVPGECPFKDKILAEVATIKENISKEKLQRREVIKAERKEKKKLLAEKRKGSQNLQGSGGGDSNSKSKSGISFEDLMKKAQERGYQFEKIEETKTQGDSSLKAFYRQFQQVTKKLNLNKYMHTSSFLIISYKK